MHAKPLDSPATRYILTRHLDGTVEYHGVDKGGHGEVMAENERVLVIKWRSGSHWVGRGIPRAYHSPSTDVLRKDEDGRFTLLISWDDRRKPRIRQKIFEQVAQ